MNKNKINRFLLVTSILSVIVLLIGATFSYFTMKTGSDTDALSVTASKIDLGLSISSVYTEHKLIPTDDSDIMTAYRQSCVDDFGFGACLAYQLELTNFSISQDIIGTIDFTVNNIENLSYMVLDENNNVYQDKVSINSSGLVNLPLGSNFILEDGSENSTSKKFILIIWLTNLPDTNQDEFDANGNFSATVDYRSIYGGKITGTINGEGNGNSDDTSQVGGS